MGWRSVPSNAQPIPVEETMTTFSDPDPEPRRFDPVMAGLTSALFLLLGSTVYLAIGLRDRGNQLSEARGELAVLQTQIEEAKKQADRDKSAHAAEIQRLNADWQSQVNAVQEATDQRLNQGMAAVAKVVDDVVNNSEATVGYLQQLEAKVRSGQQLQRAEIDKLRAVAGGLAYLNKQYEKPIEEFKELDAYVSKQLQLPPTTSPEEKGKLLRRLFNPAYREQQKAQLAEFYEDQGRREALTSMQTKVVESYGEAQRQMASIRVDQEKYLKSLDALVNGKAADIQAMDSFFQVSAKILDIHQKMMTVEAPTPDLVPPTVPKP
jgi:hypothetical protein